MESYYYNVPAADSFSSAVGLARQSKKPIKNVYDWLSDQDAYTLHRRIVRRFKRRKTYSKGINDLWQIDLVDLSWLAKDNDGYRYLLMCIDVLSKFGRVQLLKTKASAAVRDAFAAMIVDVKPTFVQSDKGTEFLNSTFQKLLIDNGIKHYTSENDDLKCAVVERWNRTILERLFRYLTYKNTTRYIDVVKDIVESYNRSFHSCIKMAPVDVTIENESEVRKRLYPPKPKTTKFKFSVSDTVRISGARRIFDKGYRGNWSHEIFKVSARYPTDPVTYSLIDESGEGIRGKFYEPELQKVKAKDVYKIERVIKTRKRKGNTEYFVKWLGYPDKFNSWVTDIIT